MKFAPPILVILLHLANPSNVAAQETLVIEGGEQPQVEQRSCSGAGCKYARSVSEKNPFGMDYGYNNSPLMSGVPTRALAMLNAQILFSEDKCPKPGKMKKFTFRQTYLGIYQFRGEYEYKRLYNEAVDRFLKNYAAAWISLDDEQRHAFCKKYLDDVTFKGNFEVEPAFFYFQYLSPMSDEGYRAFEKKVRLQEKIEWLAVFGQFLSLAAQISAGYDAYKTGKSAIRDGRAGDIASMNSKMSQSMSLYRTSNVYYNLGTYFHAVGTSSANAETSKILDAAVQSGVPSGMECETLDHFSKWDAPPDAEVWRTYQSMTSGCEVLNSTRIK